MNPQISFRRSQLEQPLNLMGKLAEALALAQAALLACDGESLETQTERQHTLCRTLLALAGEASNAGQEADQAKVSRLPGFAAEVCFPASSDRQASQELSKLALQIRHLNLVQGALLRRARRTLEILTRLQGSQAATYPAPGMERNPLAP